MAADGAGRTSELLDSPTPSGDIIKSYTSSPFVFLVKEAQVERARKETQCLLHTLIWQIDQNSMNFFFNLHASLYLLSYN